MSGKDIHVALAFDERFWPAAFATIRSVCLTSRRRKDLVFHLCYPGLSEEAKVYFDKITDECGAKIMHHDIEKNDTYQHFAQTLPHTKYISAVTYARMVFDRIISSDVQRLIYLDCDILVRAPIEELSATDLEGHPIGAVKDAHALRFSNGTDVASDWDLLDPADPYFNAGILVIDLAAWRKMDMVEQLLLLEKEGKMPRLINDQQILNHLYKNNWKQLDARWNMFAPNRAIETLDPKIVHYTGPNKPWNLINGLPFARVYRHVMTNELFYSYLRMRWARYWVGVGKKLIGRG